MILRHDSDNNSGCCVELYIPRHSTVIYISQLATQPDPVKAAHLYLKGVGAALHKLEIGPLEGSM